MFIVIELIINQLCIIYICNKMFHVVIASIDDTALQLNQLDLNDGMYSLLVT